MRRGKEIKIGRPRLSRSLIVATGLLIIAALAANRVVQQKFAATTNLPAVLGRSITTPDTEISINNVTSTPIENTDTVRINVSLDIKNIASETLAVSPGLDMLIRDTQGHSYTFTAKYSPEGTTIGGTINHGESMTMSIDFEVPSSSVLSTFIFHSEATNKQTEIKL